MTQSRSEQLFVILDDVLRELAEHESPEVIFDHIVENFAMEAEYHMGQANTFKSMLDTFRHDNPEETLPEEPDFSVTANPPRPEELYGGINDINKQYMLEDRDRLMDFLRTAHFPDTLDS